MLCTILLECQLHLLLQTKYFFVILLECVLIRKIKKNRDNFIQQKNFAEQNFEKL